MNKNLKSVSQFLADYETSERFSNASGEYFGTFEGDDHSQFSPEDLTSADGGGAMRKPVSKPYVLTIYNTTGVTVNCTLFGFNDYGTAGASNTGLVVASGIAGVSYQRMISQSQNKPFDIGLWRFSCSITSQLDQVMNVTFVDANGRTCTDPVTLTNYKDAYQQVNTIIDVWYPTKIDGNTYLVLPVLGSVNSANALTINMFPRQISDPAHQLIGGRTDKSFSTPRLSGRNTPIIQVNGGSGGKTLGA